MANVSAPTFQMRKTKVQSMDLNCPKPESESFASAGGALTSQAVRNPAIAKLRDRA